MDPQPTPPTPGTTPVFQGAEADAQILRARLNDLFNLAPEGSVLQDPERRAKLAHSAEHVAALTVELGAIQRALPGRAAAVFGTLFSGLEKDPGTGKVGAKKATGLNFLPSPFGFLDPTTVGLARNFYLPAGSTEFVPELVDIVGFGLPEQRTADEIRRAQLNANAAVSRMKTAEHAVSGESDETLMDLAAGRGGLTRAGVLRGFSGADFFSLNAAAQAELDRRAGVGVTPAAADLPAGAAAPLGSGQPEAASPVAPDAASGGAPDPATQRPINDAGKRHEQTAQGIARDLIAERADP